MSNAGIPASEKIALLGVIDPDANTAADYSTVYVDMGKWSRLLGIVMAGTLGSSATLNAKFEQAKTNNGSPKDVTSKVITELTQAGTDSDKQVKMDLCQEDLDVANGYVWARLTMTVGTATSDSGAVLLGIDPVYGPASDSDLTSVDETV